MLSKYTDDPYGVDCPCRFCDEELGDNERRLGAHRECIRADQEEVDAIAEAILAGPPERY